MRPFSRAVGGVAGFVAPQGCSVCRMKLIDAKLLRLAICHIMPRFCRNCSEWPTIARARACVASFTGAWIETVRGALPISDCIALALAESVQVPARQISVSASSNVYRVNDHRETSVLLAVNALKRMILQRFRVLRCKELGRDFRVWLLIQLWKDMGVDTVGRCNTRLNCGSHYGVLQGHSKIFGEIFGQLQIRSDLSGALGFGQRVGRRCSLSRNAAVAAERADELRLIVERHYHRSFSFLMRSLLFLSYVPLSLSETQSCWQLISNRAMLQPYAKGL
ncbi:hypothetical protein SAMN05443247_05018 [Bradyrhizobium erythrophlei]|jgi:hypothetical protein|nr:hypothetical protein SAMN05443247_05018 [Bradyrhizobium erythrophlei]